MQVDMYYDNGTLKLNHPDSAVVDTYASKPVDQPFTYQQFKASFPKQYLNRLRETDSLLFVLNDAHRSTPTAQLLSWFHQLDASILEKADILIACGTHEVPDEAQLQKILGGFFFSHSSRVKFHKCHDDKTKKPIGNDKFGEEVSLNEELFNYTQICIINSVEPHYFAGYTGGRKSICPGLADFKTIERNHNLANSLDCAPMRLDGNPMAEHLENILDLALANVPSIKSALTIQVVYDSKKQIGGLYFGDIRSAFTEAVTYAETIYRQTFSEPYDIALLEILPPLDKTVYQAQKALENNQLAVKDKGYAVIVSSCYEGIGSKHFFELADIWDADNNCSTDGKQHFGSHKLSRVNAMSRRIHTGLYSNANPEEVKKVFYEPIDNLQHLLDALSTDSSPLRIAVVHDAGHLVLQNE